MKKNFIFFFYVLIASTALAQERFQGTIKPGSTPNSIIIAITPNTTFTDNFTNVTFTIQVPDSVSPQPNLLIKNNFLSTYIPTAGFDTASSHEGDYYTYLINGVATGTPDYSFVAGTEIPVLELEFQDGPKEYSDVMLVHLASGGSTGFFSFYVEIDGVDMTNYTATFYGTGVSNGGAYEANSSVLVADILLPVNWLKSDAIRRENDVLVTWSVTNEVNCAYYEVERSENGRTFVSVGKVVTKGGFNSINDYAFTDKNVAQLKKSMIHYRIRQVDLDGKKNYSKISTLRYDMKAVLLHLAPNPANSRTILTIDLPANERVLISIIDARGRIVSTQNVNFLKGINQYSLDVITLAKGSYDVTLRSETLKESLKLIRQ